MQAKPALDCGSSSYRLRLRFNCKGAWGGAPVARTSVFEVRGFCRDPRFQVRGQACWFWRFVDKASEEPRISTAEVRATD